MCAGVDDRIFSDYCVLYHRAGFDMRAGENDAVPDLGALFDNDVRGEDGAFYDTVDLAAAGDGGQLPG